MKRKKAAGKTPKRAAKRPRVKKSRPKRLPQAHAGSPLVLHQLTGHGVSRPVTGRPVSLAARFRVKLPDGSAAEHELSIYQPHFDGKDWAATLVLPQLEFGPRDICGQSPEEAVGLAIAVARALYTGKTLETLEGKPYRWPKHESPLDDLPVLSQTRLLF